MNGFALTNLLSSSTKTWSFLARLCAVGLVVASPWIRPSTRPSTDRAVVFVVDRSASMGDKGINEANVYLMRVWPEKATAKLGVVAFAGAAEIAAPLGAEAPPFIAAGNDGGASDLAGGLRLARAMLPREGHRSIVVLSDIHPTRGDASIEVRDAAATGIRVDVVPIGGEKLPTPLVTAVRARSIHAAEHQPVAFDVDVHADQPFAIRWTRDGVAMPAPNPYALWKGAEPGVAETRHVELLDPDPPPGVHVYAVTAGLPYRRGAAEEAAPSVLTAVSVEGKAQAIVFSGFGEISPSLAAALTESGLEARLLPLAQATRPEAYVGADLIVLEDAKVSAATTDDSGLTRAAQTSLVEYIGHGGGLLVTGGAFGLAPEVAGTPLARVLPVEIEDRGHVEDPPVALVIMLDRSGSMMAQVGSHTKLELAIEASLATTDVLRPTDLVALASVDTETSWDIPLGPVSRVESMKAAVRRVEPGGGGIYVYTALKDAYAALAPAKMPIRHVILFSDTSDSEQQSAGCEYGPCGGGRTSESLAREARSKGITTTVVGIGEEEASDTPFLRRLAAAAGGRFYLTTEGTDLRRIFLSETRVLAQSNLRQKKTAVSAAGPHPVLEGVDTRKLPAIGAYVETGRRAGADTALVLADGRPLVATWRYGLGKVGAIATDLTEGWGESMGRSPAAAQVLKQTVRYLLRQRDARRADASIRLLDRVVEMDIELPPDAPESAAPAALDVRAVAEGGNSRPVAMTLEPRGPGRWLARGRIEGDAIVIARARDERGAIMAEAVGRQDQSAELVSDEPDLHAAEELARVGGGRVSPSARDTLLPTARPTRTLVASWPYALVAAAFLVVLDLVLRRLGERQGPRQATART